MKTYNEEIKVLADLENRYANIECRGSYGNNPDVTILSRQSTIYNGFIKKVDSVCIGKDENGEYMFDRFLYIDSEYGREIELPYDKILGMDILTSKEQADLERHIRNKERWNNEIERLTQLLTTAKNEVSIEFVAEHIDMYKSMIEKGEELIKKGIKTFK